MNFNLSPSHLSPARMQQDNISPDILKKVQKNLQEENMKLEVVQKVSKAASGLCMWVHAMDVYSRVAKEVEPKKAKLAEMNKVLADANSKLAEKQAELKVRGNLR